MKSATLLQVLALVACTAGCNHNGDKEWIKGELDQLEAKWGYEVCSALYQLHVLGIKLQQWGFKGIGSFAHLHYVKCLTEPVEPFDIAILGAPFDTAVTYRPGARFGPRAIRHASGRQSFVREFNPRASINPYQNWAKIVDCGDIPITPIDNNVAQTQMTEALKQLGKRQSASPLATKPRIITLGGDHSLTLPALRALNEIYGKPVQVLYFDVKPLTK